MNSLVKELIRPLLEQESVTAVFGGGFKPPTKGHFDIVKTALEDYPEIDKLIIYVGGGSRDGIGQEQSLAIWDIYKDILGDKVQIIPSSAPIGDVVRYARDNQNEKVYFLIGARKGRDDDMADVAQRTKGIEDKYPNTSIKLITTPDAGMSGTNARKAIGKPEEFIKFLPSELQQSEKETVYNIVSKSMVKESVNFTSLEKVLDDMFEDLDIDINFTNHFKERVIERGLTEEDIIELMSKIHDTYGDEVADLYRDENRVFTHLKRLVDIAAVNTGYGDDYLKDLVLKTAYKRNSPDEPEFKTNSSSPKLVVKEHSMGETIDLLPYLAKLTQHMINKGYNIEPLPGLTLVDDDVSNAEDFFGKTAYYDPNERIIVLYTHGRHPKDIARSYAHEMIHHIQNLEDRLGDITTTNTQEDDYLNDIEAEANLKGTMTFRNWTDSLQEKKNKDPFGLNAFAYELARLDEGVIFENEELNTLSLYSPGEIRSMDLPKGGGIYFWWVNSEAAAVIDGLSPNAQVGMCQKRDINGEEYSLVYVGLAKNLNQRVKDWHINQKHSDSAVRSGFISTLRHTIAAVLGQNLYAQEAINDFQNNYMLVGFIETEDYKNEELKFIGSCSLPLNIRDNKNHPFYKELKALRKISKQNSKEKLNEGVYDSLTTKLTKATIQKWVADFKKDPKRKTSFIDLDIEDVDGKGRDIEFNYVGMLKFDKKVDGYVVDGTSNSGEEEDKIPFIATLFTVNPKVLPQAWSQMSADVSDVIRHEIEHLTQSGENVRSGKYMDDDIMIRDMINKLKILPKSDYYKLEKEVDAMLQGLYLKAKKTRKPFADVINNYLDIAPGIETKEDKEIILNLWRSRRKALSLPLFENEEVMNYTIYSDMDGVLSDFDKRFMQFSDGIPPGQYEQRKGKEEFWKLIDSTVGVPFWAGMDWMPDGKEYWSYIEKYNPIILSAPSKNEESKYGKRIWKKRNMPNNKMILVPAWKKKEYATPTSILIDDRADNINQWEAAGGIGILHTDAASTIAKLKELGL
jgi:hypothetical protein